MQTQEVSLDGGASETLSFSITPDTIGDHTVSIGDLSGTIEVKAPETPSLPIPVSALLPVPATMPIPASFTVTALSVTPSEVKRTEQVTISTVVTNTGGSEGIYTVVLQINGKEEVGKEVTLGVGQSDTVIFTIAKDTEGSYTVNIDGKVGQFTVVVPPPPTPIPTEVLPVSPPVIWALIGGLIAGFLVVVGLLVYFFVWRKRGALRPS